MSTVFLDHIIPRESLRYIDQKYKNDEYQFDTGNRSDFRLRDISDHWFQKLRKPDFQRETKSWSPFECVDFLDSLVHNLVIPGIIVWKSDDSGFLFVIDGAHRLSVIRAWMIDDWGEQNNNRASSLYEAEITEMATYTRNLVKTRIGSFEDYKKSSEQCREITEAGGAPRSLMSEQAFFQNKFYNTIQDGAIIPTQWICGSYEVAEQSFLKINKGGQKLNSFEQSLIEFRNGPYARISMSIINGENGHFWPTKDLDPSTRSIVENFNKITQSIHKILFVPPFDGDIVDLNQPLVVSKQSQQYEDALELLALISENKFLNSDEAKRDFLHQMHDSPPIAIIQNANNVLNVVIDRLSQLVGENTNPKSLSIVPAIYTYNHQGIYSKNLLYAFIYWLFCKKDLTQDKKIALTSVRGMFELVLMLYKSSITSIASSKGGNFKTTKDIASTINNIIIRLIKSQRKKLTDKDTILDIENFFKFQPYLAKTTKSRSASKSQRNAINLEQLFHSGPRCQICNGLINLKLGKQYDHFFTQYAETRETDPQNMKPVHPFCNNMKHRIERAQKGEDVILLPDTITPDKQTSGNQVQLSLFSV